MPRHNFDQIIKRRGTDSIKWNAYPEDVIPMWVADSDFGAPAEVLEALAERVSHPAFGYADMDGLLDVAARHWLRSRFGWAVAQGHSVFAPGVVAAVSLAIRVLTRPGENVVTLSPAYPPLIHKAAENGRKSLASPMHPDQNGRYAINFDDLEEKLSRRETGLFILCNPHNPTGRVFSREELLRIGQLCLENEVPVFSDEIHCDYVHSGEHICFSSLSPALAQNSLVAINPSKTFNIAGLHSATVLTENAEFLASFKHGAEAAGLHPNILGATAFHAAYTQCAYYADEVREYVAGNLRFAVDFIGREIPVLRAAMPEASYLLWVDCRRTGLSQQELMDFSIKKNKVAPSSGSAFNSLRGHEGDGFVRLNLACPRATVEEALARLKDCL